MSIYPFFLFLNDPMEALREFAAPLISLAHPKMPAVISMWAGLSHIPARLSVQPKASNAFMISLR